MTQPTLSGTPVTQNCAKREITLKIRDSVGKKTEKFQKLLPADCGTKTTSDKCVFKLKFTQWQSMNSRDELKILFRLLCAKS